MASQRPPAWFRLSSMRAAAPPPVRPAAPVRPPAIVRPAIPAVRPPPPPPPTQPPPPPPPTQAQAPPPPPPASLPPTAPPSPPIAAPVAAPVPPTRSPVVTPTPQPSPVAAPKSPPPPPTPPPPSSPVTKAALSNFQQPSPSQLNTSPQSKPTSPVETVNGKAAATPEASPKIVKPWEKSHAQSPMAMMKPLSSNPPSPLSLPPPQMKTLDREMEPRMEQKNVLVQEKPMKTQNSHNHGKRQVAAKDNKKASDSEESGMRIITIAGENRGAVMEIASSRPHILNKINGESKDKQKNGKTNTMQTQPITTFLNSNVQGINNSIVFNTKCHHNDPGIHLSRQLQVTKPNPRPHEYDGGSGI